MGERTTYEPGFFCRIDLSTTDLEGSAAYYAELLGWEVQRVPMEGVGTTATMRLRGREVAAMHPQGELERAQGLPPYWQSYVAVADVDRTAAQVAALGGQVLVEPFDVLALGRMAAVLDPAGAFFSLWQARSYHGAQLVNEPGAWCWNTLAVPDVAAVEGFYAELLGWTMTPAGAGSSVITLGGTRVAGVQLVPAGMGIPPNWSVAFAVEDIAEGHRRAVAGGGRELVPPQDVVVGHYGVLSDPQGGAFGLYSGELDP